MAIPFTAPTNLNHLNRRAVSLMPFVNLRSMTINQSGIIRSVKVGGELGRRIREMGLVPGTEITIKQRAPLNDPVALRVMGGTLTLRNNEADYIEVEI